MINALAKDKPKDFDEWILRCLGRGIADIFMRRVAGTPASAPSGDAAWGLGPTLLASGLGDTGRHCPFLSCPLTPSSPAP